MTDEIRTSVQWLAEKDYLPADLRIKAIKLGLVHSREVKAISYQPIRDTLWANVYDAVYDFLNSRQQSSNAARMLAAKVSQAYVETADIAYVDGGGSLPMDED